MPRRLRLLLAGIPKHIIQRCDNWQTYFFAEFFLRSGVRCNYDNEHPAAPNYLNRSPRELQVAFGMLERLAPSARCIRSQ